MLKKCLPRIPLSFLLMGQTCNWLVVEVKLLSAWAACSWILGKRNRWGPWQIGHWPFCYGSFSYPCLVKKKKDNSLNVAPCICNLILWRALSWSMHPRKETANACQSCGSTWPWVCKRWDWLLEWAFQWLAVSFWGLGGWQRSAWSWLMVGLSQNLEKELLSEAIRNTHANMEGQLGKRWWLSLPRWEVGKGFGSLELRASTQ